MNMAQEDEIISARGAKLLAKFEKGRAFEEKMGRINYWSAYVLVVASLGCSVAVALGGLLLAWDKAVLGGLAAVPPVVGFIAAGINFQGRAHWHYQKMNRYDELLSRLNFQLPVNPRAENIAAIAAAYDAMVKETQKTFEQLAFKFDGFIPKRKPD
jgi:hypothetical protein